MGFFSKLKDGVKAAAAAGKEDDAVAAEMYKIFGQLGYQVGNWKHTEPTRKMKPDGSMKQKPEKWGWTLTSQAGTWKMKVSEEGGLMKVSLNKAGVKSKTKFHYKNYVLNKGGNISIQNRDGLVAECRKLLQ